MKKDLVIIGYVMIFMGIIAGAILARMIPKELLYNFGFTVGFSVIAGFDFIREAKGK